MRVSDWFVMYYLCYLIPPKFCSSHRECIKEGGFQFVKCKGSNRSCITSRKNTSLDRMKHLGSIYGFEISLLNF